MGLLHEVSIDTSMCIGWSIKVQEVSALRCIDNKPQLC